MKTASVFTLTVLLGLSAAPTPAQARPPWEGAQRDDRAARVQLVDSRRDYSEYRYTTHEREALRQRLSHREFHSLPPGLQKKVARGSKLPPGWQKKLQKGQRLPDSLYYNSQRLPSYEGIRPIDGVSDVIIDNEVVRVIDATQTILDVFGINR